MVGMGKMSKAIWSERASRFIEGAAETAMNLRASSGNFLRALLLGVSLSALGTSDAFAGAVRVIGRTSGVDHGTRMEYYQQAQAEGEAATAAFVALGNASAAQVHAGNAAGLQELRDGKEAMELAASMARTGFAVRRDSAWTDASGSSRWSRGRSENFASWIRTRLRFSRHRKCCCGRRNSS